MKKNEKKELFDKTTKDLKKTLEELEKEFFDLKMEKEQGRLKNTSAMTNTRKKIAVVKTYVKQKESAEVESSSKENGGKIDA